MNNDDAIREAHRNSEESKYFDARPQIDCIDRRRVFEAGFDRGWDSARGYVMRFLKAGETIEQCLDRNRRDIDTLMALLADEKKKSESLAMKVTSLELAEEGAKIAYGHLIEQKESLYADLLRTRNLLNLAYADIKSMNSMESGK